jgi:hypothetical protein
VKGRELVLVILAAALLLRGVGAADSLWLDEIWSLNIALGLPSGAAPSFGAMLRQSIAENCHLLTASWMFVVGDTAHGWIYRLPSLLFSVLSLGLATRLGQELEGPRGRWLYALVFGCSYFLIEYGTEARGYSGVAFHCLVGFAILQRDLARPTRPRIWNWIFGVNALLGLLSHPVFLAFLAGAGAWSCFRIAVETRFGDRRFIVASLERFALPTLLGIALMRSGLSLETRASGVDSTLGEVTVDFLHYGFGAPLWSLVPFATALALAVFVVRALQSADDDDERSSLRLQTFLVAAPFLMLAVSSSDVLYARFLTPALPFLYMLVIRGVLRTYDRLESFRAPAKLLLALFLLGQGTLLVPFVEDGRGHYLAALQQIAASDPSPVIRVGVDHPFRTGTLIDYFATKLTPPRRFEKLRLKWVSAATRPNWLLLHRVEDDEWTPQSALERPGIRYELQSSFRKFGPSGCHWYLYRLTEPRAPERP